MGVSIGWGVSNVSGMENDRAEGIVGGVVDDEEDGDAEKSLYVDEPSLMTCGGVVSIV